MSEQQPIHEEKPAEKPAMKVTPGGAAPPRRRGISLFAPLVLIAAGVLFLLDNLGVIGDLNWAAAAQYWPLALIFLGLNVLASQVRRPLGTILSGLVALAAVGVFGYLLIAGSPDDTLRSLGLPGAVEARQEAINVPPGAATSAAVRLNLTNYATQVAANDGAALVSGSIWTRTGPDVERTDDGDRAIVTVGERGGGFTFNPANWGGKRAPGSCSCRPPCPST